MIYVFYGMVPSLKGGPVFFSFFLVRLFADAERADIRTRERELAS